MDEQWNLVISSLQDICNANVVMGYDEDVQFKGIELNESSDEKLQELLDYYTKHLQNVKGGQRLADSVGENVKIVLERAQEIEERESKAAAAEVKKDNEEEDISTGTAVKHEEEEAGKEGTPQPGVQQTARSLGRSGWVSQYNPNGPISIGSEVAFKPKKGGEGEWFQCVVVKVSADGLRFEVRDPEPDELGNPGKTFKCNWRDIIFLPPEGADQKTQTPNYPPGTKVLARYPETTTFYPAVVMGSKRDGTCRLKFDGEEEVDKETEVLRRLVLPCPTISSTMAKK